MNADIVITKALSSAIVLGFFALVIFFLRFLYGPKGKLRDPVWDEWNAQAARVDAQKAEEKAFLSLRKAFTDYAQGFFTGDAVADNHVALKIEHTYKVCECAEAIAQSEAFFLERPEAARALRIAALFHDVGRFEQLRRYRTFADAVSCNHGVLGARIIRAQGFLRDESAEVQRLVLLAVASHNRKNVSPAVSDPLRSVLYGLRDADKADIMRVMAEALRSEAPADPTVVLHLTNAPEKYSEAVLNDLQAGRIASYTDMRYFNDFRILLCTWLFDLHFPSSYRAVKECGALVKAARPLEALPRVWSAVSATFETYLHNDA